MTVCTANSLWDHSTPIVYIYTQAKRCISLSVYLLTIYLTLSHPPSAASVIVTVCESNCREVMFYCFYTYCSRFVFLVLNEITWCHVRWLSPGLCLEDSCLSLTRCPPEAPSAGPPHCHWRHLPCQRKCQSVWEWRSLKEHKNEERGTAHCDITLPWRRHQLLLLSCWQSYFPPSPGGGGAKLQPIRPQLS